LKGRWATGLQSQTNARLHSCNENGITLMAIG
jgi:hypothetical protein